MSITVAVTILVEVLVFLFCIFGLSNEGTLMYVEYKIGLKKLKNNEDIVKIRKDSNRW